MRGKMAALTIMVVVAGMLISPTRGKADDESESRIKQGFAIAPVKLNLVEKNRALVGLGSYLVNAVAGCNDCHTNSNNPYVNGGNPFLGQPKQEDITHYLAGGRSFVTPAGTFLSRNLTPDKTGLPEGGAMFDVFLNTMRAGADRHVPGRLLQVMPWPVFQDMTDHDLRAIYEYLRAIPCLEGEPGLPNPRPIGTRCQ
jgi:hypothetical protein